DAEIARAGGIEELGSAQPGCGHREEALHVVGVGVVEDVAAREEAAHTVGDDIYFGAGIEHLDAAHVIAQASGVGRIVETPVIAEDEEGGRVGGLAVVVAAGRSSASGIARHVVLAVASTRVGGEHFEERTVDWGLFYAGVDAVGGVA